MQPDQPLHRSPYFENVNEDPEYEVRKVLAEIGWTGVIPIDPLEVCDMYGFEVEFTPDPEMKEEGTTRFFGVGDFRIFIKTYQTDCLDGFSNDQTLFRRQRFTLAHEVGHCIYSSHTDIQLQQNLQNPSNPHARSYSRQREEQANLFAAHLLIPREAFKKISRSAGWSNAFRLVQQTTEAFNVSTQVAVQQVARLADIPCIAILFNCHGTPLRTPAYSADFAETGLFYAKSQDVPTGTLAAQMLEGKNSSQQSRKQYRDASIWFPNAYEWKAEKFSITETSIQLGQYGVVSFLEIEDID